MRGGSLQVSKAGNITIEVNDPVNLPTDVHAEVAVLAMNDTPHHVEFCFLDRCWVEVRNLTSNRSVEVDFEPTNDFVEVVFVFFNGDDVVLRVMEFSSLSISSFQTSSIFKT